jgi:argininosuccinate lyase
VTALWGGRFEEPLDAAFEAFNRSLSFDRRFVQQDLEGSIAWAEALHEAGVLSRSETRKLTKELRRLGKELEDDPSPLDESRAEDVHSFVEEILTERLGDVAKKLHTGRSRNDQAVTDLKLYLKLRGEGLERAIARLQRGLLDLAERHADLPLPGYTHQQRAQPVTAGHHALAYVEMLGRDRDRLSDALGRMDSSPLGSGALAGTAFPIDRTKLARRLGFKGGPTRNSLDTVGDRDFVVELVFVCSVVMLHLSRLAEDWIFFSTFEAGLIRFGDDVTTGSSLMPQKKNPDALELIRGKAGRVMGDLTGLLATLKGLPLAYDKDMQEDKEPLFDALDQTEACLTVAERVVRSATYDEDACESASATGYLNATDLADLLVQRGVPFREAHERVGRAVREAIDVGAELDQLPDERLTTLFPELGDLSDELSVPAVLARRNTIGGTAPRRVRAEVRRWKRRLD